MSVSRGDRLEALLRLLRDWPGITAGELAERLGISPRNVFRDVAMLRDRGYPVEASRGRGGGLRLDPERSVGRIPLSAEEGLGVLLGLAVAEALALPVFGRALAPARASIVEAFPAAERQRLRRLRARVLIGDAAPAAVRGSWRPPARAVMRKLQTAFVEERVMAIDHRGGPGEEGVRRVEPHALVLHWPAWYVGVRDIERASEGTFRLDRIGSVTVESGSFRPMARALMSRVG